MGVRTTALLLTAGLALAGCYQPQPSAPAPARRPTPATNAAHPEEAAVRAVYQRYGAAVRDCDGEAAVACLDQATLDWYEQLRKDALALPRAELAKQDLHRRLSVLRWRLAFDRATLEQQTGRTLLARGIQSGWVGGGRKDPPPLARLVVSGTTASASFLHAPDVPFVFFRKEPDGWKLNLTKTHPLALQQLEAAFKASGEEEETFLRECLKELTHRDVDERIFDGPLESLPK
jgi:hypothetical protein